MIFFMSAVVEAVEAEEEAALALAAAAAAVRSLCHK